MRNEGWEAVEDEALAAYWASSQSASQDRFGSRRVGSHSAERGNSGSQDAMALRILSAGRQEPENRNSKPQAMASERQDDATGAALSSEIAATLREKRQEA